MGALSFLRSVYDVDTLDTRFTTPTTVAYRTVIDARGDHDAQAGEKDGRARKPDPQAEPSKWGTPEFFLYYLVFLTAVPYMFWVAYSVSRPSDPRYSKYQPHLQPGWIPGRMIDNSDAQYASFRRNLFYMGLLLTFHPQLRRIWNAASASPKTAQSPARGTKAEAADTRLEQRTSFDFAFAMLYLVVLHGFSAIKVMIILYLNYTLARTLPRKFVPVCTWAFSVSLLFANEVSEGYRFSNAARWIGGSPTGPDLVSGSGALVRLGEWMDSYGGLIRRWEILFNITVLRLVSFNLDYYWSLDRRGGISDGALPLPNQPAAAKNGMPETPKEKPADRANLSERDRIAIPATPHDYSFRNYVAYAIYAPLYLTGPILTFNDYISQCRYPAATIETRRTIRYALRFVMALLAMELTLHFDYVGAISKAAPLWSSYTPVQLSMLSYFNLHIVWFKLLLPWRFFRLWSLVDGIDPPENMLRCVSNNYSTLSFWRSWHRSYYRWLLRYIYLPLGGSDWGTWTKAARSLVTYLLVFTFVALWHDIQPRLLVWGWLVVFFMVPEVAAACFFAGSQWESRKTQYRMLCCAGAVLNVLMMMAANLVGFAVGLDGLGAIVAGILRDWNGFLFLVTACAVLFVGIQVMFEIRQSELRRGIRTKC